MKAVGGSRIVRPETAILVLALVFGVSAANAVSSSPGMRTAAAGSPEEVGAAIYQREYCSFCHSVRDYAMSPLRASFSIGYADRLVGQWTRNGSDLSVVAAGRTKDWILAHLIDPGASMPGCPMPSYRSLPDQELDALVAFISSSSAAAKPNTPTPRPRPAVPATRDSYLAGRTLYQTYCMGCHGRDGNGNGAVGALLSPLPRDLSDPAWMERRSDDALYRIIEQGNVNTAMPGYAATLTDREAALVLFYIRFFANPSARQGMEEGWGG